jgi:hypothetical protein
MKPYRPNLKLAKELYSLRFTLARLRRGKAEPTKRIPSNSEPWVENPRTLEDVREISARIYQVLETWQPKGE